MQMGLKLGVGWDHVLELSALESLEDLRNCYRFD